jgi:PAS domain S-box-containing protein
LIRRLSAFDLPARLQKRLARPLVEIGVGVAFAAIAMILRALIEIATRGAVPFALLFPAMLLATGLAGWRSGAYALVFGTVVSLLFLPDPTHLSKADWVSVGLFVTSGTMVIAAAASYRATALALRDSEERLDLAADAAKVGVWEWRLGTDELIYSDEAKRICGFPTDRPVTLAMVRERIHPEDRAAANPGTRWDMAPQARDRRSYEYRILLPSGEQRWIYAMGRAVFEPTATGAATVRYVGTLQDITERKAAEERLRLLAREVDHRANNLLTVVQGTVALSEAKDAPALKQVITGRVNALARAHQLLAAARWEGADLGRLVQEELLPFSLGDERRVTVSGAAVALPPAPAQSVAMALHELATNAAKYGALSTTEGRVEVSWGRDQAGALSILWREIDGPPVNPPKRRGLGTTLLGRALAGPIGGRTQLDWRPEGLVCEMVLPLRDPGDPAESEPAEHAALLGAMPPFRASSSEPAPGEPAPLSAR